MSALQWWGTTFFTRGYGLEPVVGLEDTQLNPRYLYWEKQILIEALENFLHREDGLPCSVLSAQ